MYRDIVINDTYKKALEVSRAVALKSLDLYKYIEISVVYDNTKIVFLRKIQGIRIMVNL